MAGCGEVLRDAARLVRESVVVGRAVTLARWIGTGRRPVTAGQVLRKADVPAAGAAVGVEVPPRLRTMADIRALHRPWCVAVATGLRAVCAAESYPQDEDSVRLLAMALLAVLSEDGPPRSGGLWESVHAML